MRWQLPEIAGTVAAGLDRQAQEDNLEHAVHSSFDALDKFVLHPLTSVLDGPQDNGVWPDETIHPVRRDTDRIVHRFDSRVALSINAKTWRLPKGVQTTLLRTIKRVHCF